MRFEALELALVIISLLRKLLPAIARHDAKLHKQLREAGSSIPMNLAEGNRRRGKDRLFLWSVASGSADEVFTGLRTALAWGYVPEGTCNEALEHIDRLQAMLWRLMH
jgi:four helix bundle protein